MPFAVSLLLTKLSWFFHGVYFRHSRESEEVLERKEHPGNQERRLVLCFLHRFNTNGKKKTNKTKRQILSQRNLCALTEPIDFLSDRVLKAVQEGQERLEL